MPVRLLWKPIDRWPREQTSDRTWSPFRSRDAGSYRRSEIGWMTTRVDLERELEMLRVSEAVVQLALRERDIRIDGEVRADARPSHPGVILTFTAPGKGPLTFSCDKWTTWQANIRGIAKALEALRLVDRYGITSSGEQYVGWKELPSGEPMSAASVADEEMSIEQASRFVVGWISGPHDLSVNARTAVEDADYRRYAYRQALKQLHPDTGGSDEAGFLRLQRAFELLNANVG